MRTPMILGAALLVSVAAPGRVQAAAITLQVAPSAVVVPAGARARAELRVAVTGAPGARVAGFWASAGAVGKPRQVRSGVFVSTWTSPPMGFPTVVLLRADIVIGGRRVYRWAALPVSLRQKISVSANRGENVQIVANGTDYGPVKAKTTGAVDVEVVVAPWSTTYTILRTDEYGVTKSENRRFGLPAFKRLAVVAPKIASAGDEIGVEVFQVSARGKRYAYSNPVVLQCPQATVTDIDDQKSVVRFRLRLGGQTGLLQCVVFMKGEPKVSANFSLDVDVSRRLKLSLRVSRDHFKMGSAETAQVDVTVADLFGNVSDTDRLEVLANGKPLSMTRIGAGQYRGWIYAPSARQPGDRLIVLARAPGARPVRRVLSLLGGPAVKLRVRLRPAAIRADGKSSTWVEITAVDRLGMPATDRTVRVDSEQGKMAFLHRVRPGLFRGRFVPRRNPRGGVAVLVVQTRRAPAVTARLTLRRLPQRLVLSPVLGGFYDFVRSAGGTASLRFEWAAYRGGLSVYVGGAVLVAPFAATAEGDGRLVDHAGLAAGGLAVSRLRVLDRRRVSLDVAVDLGVLGLYSRFRQRTGNLLSVRHAGQALFTAAAGLEVGIVTGRFDEVFLRLAMRYMTARFEDALSTNRAAIHAAVGYRFSL